MKKIVALMLSLMLMLALGACMKPAEQAPAATEAPKEEAKVLSVDGQTSIDEAAAPAPAPASGEKKVFAFIMPNATHGFLAESIVACEKYLKEFAPSYPNVETRFHTSADVSEQNNQLDTLINDKVDLIVMWPHNGEDLRSGSQKVLDAGIKLIIYDRLVPDITPLSECDMDNFGYGKAGAEYINLYFKDKLDKGEEVHILEFRGDNSTASTVRTDGFNATKNDKVIIDQSFSTDWQKAKGLEYMESFLTNSSNEDIAKIDAVFTHDDEISMGIYEAIRNYKGQALNLKLICGMGARRENLDTFKEFKEKYEIDQFTIFVAPGIIKYAVELGYKAASGEDIPKQFKIGYEPVDNLGLTKYTDETFRSYQGYIDRYADQ